VSTDTVIFTLEQPGGEPAELPAGLSGMTKGEESEFQTQLGLTTKGSQEG
jgi:hypothetical protein